METCVEEQGRKMVLGMTVSATSGSYQEERHFLDAKAAFEQHDLFQKAGYKKVEICPRYFTYDEGEWYVVLIEVPPVRIDSQAAPAQHTRAKLNPGIKLRKYEREVLQRPRVTVAELFISVIASLLLIIAPLAAILIAAGQMIVRAGYQAAIVPGVLMICVAYLVMVIPRADYLVDKVERFVGIPSEKEWNAD